MNILKTATHSHRILNCCRQNTAQCTYMSYNSDTIWAQAPNIKYVGGKRGGQIFSHFTDIKQKLTTK